MDLAFLVHAANAVLHDDGDFVGEGRIVGEQLGTVLASRMAVAVLVLQAFAGKRGASGGAAAAGSPCRAVAGGPDEIADALEAEHRIVDEERNHLTP